MFLHWLYNLVCLVSLLASTNFTVMAVTVGGITSHPWQY